MYIASYPPERRGVELVNSFNVSGASRDWTLVNSDYREAAIAGKSVTVAEYLLARGGERRLEWMWYLAGDQLTANPYRIKALQAEFRLLGRPQNVSLFAVSARVSSQPSQAIADLSDFARQMSFPGLTSKIPGLGTVVCTSARALR